MGKLVAAPRRLRLPLALGFRDGISSVHTSRTMMLAELSLVFDHLGPKASADEFLVAIVEHNVLGKPTQATRKRSAQRLSELYSFDPTLPVFRTLRHFWTADSAGQPLLAYLAAAARDPLLRDSMPFVMAVPVGGVVDSKNLAQHLEEKYPERFSPATLISTAQNLASSWTQAGYLSGRLKKKRTRPVVTPVVVTFALLLGYLCGTRGKMLFDTIWTRMLDRTPAEMDDFAIEASKQGWMTFKAVGAVVEVTFPGLLTPQEEKLSNESD